VTKLTEMNEVNFVAESPSLLLSVYVV